MQYLLLLADAAVNVTILHTITSNIMGYCYLVITTTQYNVLGTTARRYIPPSNG